MFNTRSTIHCENRWSFPVQVFLALAVEHIDGTSSPTLSHKSKEYPISHSRRSPNNPNLSNPADHEIQPPDLEADELSQFIELQQILNSALKQSCFKCCINIYSLLLQRMNIAFSDLFGIAFQILLPVLLVTVMTLLIDSIRRSVPNWLSQI